MNTTTIGLVVAGFLIGFLIAWLITRSRAQRVAQEMEVNNRALQKKLDERDRDLKTLRTQVDTLTTGKVAVDDELAALNTQLNEANTALVALEDRLNAALAGQMTAEAALNDVQVELAAAQADAAELASQLDEEMAARRQLAADLETSEQQVAILTRDLTDLQEAIDNEHARTDAIAKSYLLKARLDNGATHPVSAESAVAQLVEDAEPAALRQAFIALAAVKAHDDAVLRQHEMDQLDAAAQIASMRYSLNILTANGAYLAAPRTLAPVAPASASPEMLAELDALRRETLALRANADAVTADKVALEAAIQERESFIEDLRTRITEALATLQPVIAEGENGAHLTDEAIVEEQTEPAVEEAENLIDVEELVLLDGAETPVDAAPWEETWQPAEADVEPAAATPSEADRLTTGVAAVLVAFARKNSTVEDLEASLDAALVEKSELAAALDERTNAYNSLMARIDGLGEELEAAVAPVQTAEIAETTEAPVDTDLEPGALSAEAIGDAEMESSEPVAAPADAESESGETADAPEAGPALTGVDRLAAGVAAVLAALQSKDSNLATLHSANDELAAGKAALEGELAQQQADLEQVSGRVANWIEELRTRFADDPELLGMLDGAANEAPATVEGVDDQPADGVTELAEQPAEETATPVDPTMQADAAPVAEDGQDDGSTSDTPPAAPPQLAVIGLLGAGIAAVTAALQKREDAQGQLQGDLDKLTALKSQLEADLAERDGALDDLAQRVAAAQVDLQALANDVPEVAALFAPSVAETADEEAAVGEADAVDESTEIDGGPIETAPVAQAAEAEDVDGDAAAQENVANDDVAQSDSPTASAAERALAGVGVLAAGVAALGTAIHARTDSLAQVQTDLEATTVAKTQAEESLAENEQVLNEVSDRLHDGTTDLRSFADDTPELAAVLPSSDDDDLESAEEGETEEQDGKRTGKRVLARLAVFMAGVAALGRTMRKRNEALAASQAEVESLTTHQSELEASLQQSSGDLNTLADRISALQNELQNVAVGVPELASIMAVATPEAEEGAAPPQDEETPAAAPDATPTPEASGEGAPVETEPTESTADQATLEQGTGSNGADASPVARALAGLTVLSSGVAAFGAALRGKDDALNALQGDLAGISAARDELQTRLDASGASLDELSQRAAALAEQFQAVAASDPDFQSVLQSVLPTPASDDATILAETPEQESAPEVALQTDVADSSTPEAEPPQAQALGKLALVAAGVTALGEVLAKKNQSVADLTADLDAVLVTQAEVESSLAQREAELTDMDAQLDAWRTELLAAVADDAELAALLQPAAEQPVASDGVEAAADDETVAQTDAPAALSRAGLLAAGAAATRGLLQKKDASLAALQANLDELTAAKVQLEADLTQRSAELDDLSQKIAAAHLALRDAVADDAELAALFDQPLPAATTDEAGATRSAGVELGQESGPAMEVETSTQAALAAFAKKNEVLARMQSEFDALAVDKTKLETDLGEREAQLAELNARIAEWHAQLQESMADDPEVQILLAGPTPESEETSDQRLAGLALLGASAAAVNAALDKQRSQLADADAQAADLQALVNTLGADKSTLEETLQQKDEALAALQQDLDALNEKIAALQADLESAETAKAQLEGELKESQEELDELTERITQVSDQLRDELGDEAFEEAMLGDESPRGARLAKAGLLTAGVTKAVGTKRKQDEELEQTSARLAETEEQVAALTADKTSLESTLQEKEAALAEAQAQVANASEQLTQLQGELDAAIAAKTQLESDVQQRQAALDEITSRITQLQADLETGMQDDEELKTLFAARSAEIVSEEAQPEGEDESSPVAKIAGVGLLAAGVAAAIDANRMKGGALNDANKRIADADFMLAALNSDKAQLESSVQAKDSALAEQTAVVEALTAEKSTLEATLQEKESALTEAQSQIDALNLSVEEGAKALEEVNGQLAALQNELAETQAAKAQLESDLAAKTDELTQLEAELAQLKEDSEKTVADKVAEIAALTAAAAAAAATIKQKNDELEQANAEIASLQQQIDAAKAAQERTAAEAQSQTAALQSRLDNRDSQVSQLQSQNDNLRQENRQLQGQISNLENDLANERSDRRGGRVVGAAAVTAGTAAAVGARRERSEAEEAAASQASAQMAEMQQQMAALQAQLAAVTAAQAAASAPEAPIAPAAAVILTQESAAETEEAPAEASQEASAQATRSAMIEIGVEEEAAEGTQSEGAESEETEEFVEGTASAEIAAEEAIAAEESGAEIAAEVADIEEQAVPEVAVEEEEGSVEIDAEVAEIEEVAAAEIIAEEGEIEEVAVEEIAIEVVAEDDEVVAAVVAAAAMAEHNAEDEESAAESGEAASETTGEAEIGQVAIRTASILQDLAQVHGIGATLERRLHHAGIGTFWELATAPLAELEDALALTGFAREGVDLEAIQADALRLAQETFTVGLTWDRSPVDDLSALPRLGETYKRRLYEAGITNFEAISKLTPEELAEICRAPKVNPPDFEAWIRQATKWAEELREVGSNK